MRLIDADRLFENVYDNVPAPYEDSREAKEECLCAIEGAPTVDAVLVVHGRWEVSTDEWFETDVYTCSKCRESYVLVEGTPKENLWHYCPNCGAKMDGNWKQTT